LVFQGVLEAEAAPRTCETFVTLLPLRATMLHARWSGEAGWVPLDQVDARLGPEHATQRPLPGQVLFYPGGISPVEILVPYGVSGFAAKTGPLLGNHFLTIPDAEEQLRAMGRRLLWEGAQEVEFDHAS
jgi:hypothetical protein